MLMISNVNYSCEIEVWSVYMEDSGAVGVCMGIFEFSLLKNYMQELLIAKNYACDLSLLHEW